MGTVLVWQDEKAWKWIVVMVSPFNNANVLNVTSCSLQNG
jgi:hypothetical protein